MYSTYSDTIYIVQVLLLFLRISILNILSGVILIEKT